MLARRGIDIDAQTANARMIEGNGVHTGWRMALLRNAENASSDMRLHYSGPDRDGSRCSALGNTEHRAQGIDGSTG